jgi:hypothetical protein
LPNAEEAKLFSSVLEKKKAREKKREREKMSKDRIEMDAKNEKKNVASSSSSCFFLTLTKNNTSLPTSSFVITTKIFNK